MHRWWNWLDTLQNLGWLEVESPDIKTSGRAGSSPERCAKPVRVVIPNPIIYFNGCNYLEGCGKGFRFRSDGGSIPLHPTRKGKRSIN